MFRFIGFVIAPILITGGAESRAAIALRVRTRTAPSPHARSRCDQSVSREM
jgi:hypothetical protein